MVKWSSGEIPGDWSNSDAVKSFRPLQQALDKWIEDNTPDVPEDVIEHVNQAADSLKEAANLMVGPVAGPMAET